MIAETGLMPMCLPQAAIIQHETAIMLILDPQQ